MVKNSVRTSGESAIANPRTYLRPRLRLSLRTQSRAGKLQLSALGTKYTIKQVIFMVNNHVAKYHEIQENITYSTQNIIKQNNNVT